MDLSRNHVERYFSPMLNVTAGEEYSYTNEKGARQDKKEFGHGHSVPSCDACQKLIPEILCDNHKECT